MHWVTYHLTSCLTKYNEFIKLGANAVRKFGDKVYWILIISDYLYSKKPRISERYKKSQVNSVSERINLESWVFKWIFPDIAFLSREEWERGKVDRYAGISIYTDGPKLDNRMGVGVFSD